MSPSKKNLIQNNQSEIFIDIDKLQKKAINMLKDVKKVLDKYDLIYMLYGGPLLGYTRNKKFLSFYYPRMMLDFNSKKKSIF